MELGESSEGQTPVDADDAQHLTEEYSWIATREELNDAEASNIADGMLWLGDQELAATTLTPYAPRTPATTHPSSPTRSAEGG